MQADILTLAKIIDTTYGGNSHYQVPKYQREYSWKKKHLEELFSDVTDNDIGYFMGPIIVVRVSNNEIPGSQIVYELVDGQQRLTTLSLWMIALYERMQELAETHEFTDDEDRDEFESYRKGLAKKLVIRVDPDDDHTEPHYRGFSEKGKNCYIRLQPSTQSDNETDYRYALGETGLISPTSIPAWFGNRRIGKTLSYFRDVSPETPKEAIRLLKKLDQLKFVYISVGTQADAFTLFETLNNRGLELSKMDIIKNTMLAQMQKAGVSIDDSFAQWQQIVENVEGPQDEERFLRHFYNANHWDENIQVAGLRRASKAKLIAVYEKIIGKNPQLVFDKLCAAANEYGPMTYPSWFPDAYDDENLTRALTDLEGVNASPSYQLLLYLFTQPAEKFPEPDFYVRAVDLLRNFYVRRNVTDFPGTAALDQTHVDTIAECHRQLTAMGTLTFDFLRDQITAPGRYSSIDTFRERLSGAMYFDNVGMTRYLLIKLNELFDTKENTPDLRARDSKDKYVWTIEHILPQTRNLPESWINDLAGGDASKASDLQQEHVNQLGNLTLSGYNSRLSVLPFLDKQSLTEKKVVANQTIPLGYKNSLALNQLSFVVDGTSTTLADAPTWNASMIQARTDTMVEELIKMFAFDSETP